MLGKTPQFRIEFARGSTDGIRSAMARNGDKLAVLYVGYRPVGLEGNFRRIGGAFELKGRLREKMSDANR